MNNDHTCAIIGLGRWGKILLSEFSHQVDVTHCHTKGNSESVSWLAMNYPDTVFVDNYDEILSDTSIEALIIATPITTHFDLAYRALAAKKHVFLEKSPVMKKEQLLQLDDLSKQTRRCLFVDHVFSYREEFNLLKRSVVDKEILSISCHWLKFGSFHEDIHWNLLYHFLYLLVDLCGPNELMKLHQSIEITGVSHRDVTHIKVEDSGLPISIYINRLSDVTVFSIVMQFEDVICIWRDSHFIRIDRTTGSVLEKVSVECQPVTSMVKAFWRSIDEGSEGLVTPYAYESVSLLEHLQNSQKR